jgi:hypothetical protein
MEAEAFLADRACGGNYRLVYFYENVFSNDIKRMVKKW